MSDTTDTYRARIVEALRREADRIEVGGAPYCYAQRCADGLEAEINLTVFEARESIQVRVEDDGLWPDEVDCQEWGVVVSIEDVRRVAHQADLSGRVDGVFDVQLVDSSTPWTEPAILPQDCPECGEEVPVPPGGVCPVCAGDGGES